MQLAEENLKQLRTAAKRFGLEVDRLCRDLPTEQRIAHVSRLANEFVAKVAGGAELRAGETRAGLEEEARDLLFNVLEKEGGFAPGELVREASETQTSELPSSPDIKLEVNGQEIACVPDDLAVEAALCSLADAESFLILSRSAMTYMQAAGNRESGFAVEYQDGALDAHFRCDDESLDFQAVAELLKLYLRGDARWRTAVEWRHLPL